MKKEIISILDGEVDKKATLGEKIAISLVVLVSVPIVVIILLISLFLFGLYFEIIHK